MEFYLKLSIILYFVYLHLFIPYLLHFRSNKLILKKAILIVTQNLNNRIFLKDSSHY